MKNAKKRVVPIAKALAEMGFKIYATAHTADVLNAAASMLQCFTRLRKLKLTQTFWITCRSVK